MSTPPEQSKQNPISSRRKRQRSAGFVTMTVLLIALLAFVCALTMVGLSQTQVRSSTRSQDRMTGLVLAEAGIDDAVGQLVADAGFSGRSATIYEDPGTNSKSFGTFTTTITAIDAQKRKIVSVGTNKNGTTASAVAILTVETRALGNAAIMAKGNVNIGGNVLVNSIPTPNLGISHVLANGNVSMGGSSIVDGILSAGGTVTGGVGSLGTAEGVPPYPYPDTATTTAWRTAWIAESKLGPNRGNINNSTTIQAPAFINGNITLTSSDKVEIKGPGIVYVAGSVNLTAQSQLVNGATLVVAGTFGQQGQSVYKITPGMTPTATTVVYGDGYGPTADVISLTGGSLADQQGVVYAVNGSIKVAGGSIFVGALVAGGTGSQIYTNGGYTHKFPENMSSKVVFPTAAQVVGVTEL